MSYHLRQRYSALSGGALGGLTQTVQTIASAITPAADIATDPYLPEVICRAKQLVAIEDGVPVPPCQSLPGGMRGGIGFRKVMVPLRAYVRAERTPILYPVAFAVAVGVPLLIGYAIGKRRP